MKSPHVQTAAGNLCLPRIACQKRAVSQQRSREFFGRLQPGRFTVRAQADSVEVARKFYEEGWSQGDIKQREELLSNLIAEDHIQEDQVWQESPRHGRDSLVKGIAAIRKFYPDTRFYVEEAAPVASGDKVFVKWRMEGTFEGDAEKSRGLSFLTIENGQIARTEVYRQVLKAELQNVRQIQQKFALKQGQPAKEPSLS